MKRLCYYIFINYGFVRSVSYMITKFKRYFAAAVAGVICIYTITSLVNAQSVNVTINNNKISFANQEPIIVNGRVLVPLRGIFDRLGYQILWDNDKKEVSLYKSAADGTYNYINITIGNDYYTKDGQNFGLDVPAQIINGSTMIPLRAIANATGYEVEWDSSTSTVTIKTTPITTIPTNSGNIVIWAPQNFGVEYSGNTNTFNGITAHIYWESIPYVTGHEIEYNGSKTLLNTSGTMISGLNPASCITIKVNSVADINGKRYITGQNTYQFKTPGISIANSTIENDGNAQVRKIEWSATVSNRTFTQKFPINKEAYSYYCKLQRYHNPTDYINYIDDKNNRALLKSFADGLKQVYEENGYDRSQALLEAINFVQLIPYKYDIDSKGQQDYPKYPIETLYEYNGDCEDASILLVGILREMGYDTCFIWFDNHIGVGISGAERIGKTYFDVNGKKYFYVEATGQGWNLGDYPFDSSQSAKIVEVK